jgi:hypothetical protein
VLRPYLLRRRYGEGVTGHLDDNLTKGLRAQNAARRPTNLGWYEQNVARDQQLCARPTWKSWCDQNLPQDEAALEAAKARAAQEGQAQELVTVTPEAIITVDQTDRKATLGVWSRNEMARVDFEGGGVVRPFIADGLIGRSPS